MQSLVTNRPRIEIVGVMLGLSAITLTEPFVHSWWPGMLIAVSVAALGAFTVGQAVNSLPLVSAARLATVTTVIICGGGMVAAVIAGPRANAGQEFAIVLAGYVMLRLIGATVDRLTSWVNISRAEQLKAPWDQLLTGAQAVTRPVDIHTNHTGGPMSRWRSARAPRPLPAPWQRLSSYPSSAPRGESPCEQPGTRPACALIDIADHIDQLVDFTSDRSV
ncbi:hypothetical protein [Streptomyces sp. cf386]|uniref:hypothetical protein n=1 Tax=Streptomyces sp. cf386 TaxID=1761904 RepID=UPI00115F8663|nr:hypothetical protein [Streptomyces sp. cf386]